MVKRKFAAAVLAACAAFGAMAEGYQVNSLSARQNGMGHTGTALHLGSESMIFNPAGLGFLDKAIDFQGSVTGIFAHATAKVNGTDWKTSNPASTPMAFNLGMKVYDNFAAGISFYTPYGSTINWGENWPGAVLNQKVSLKAFTVQPTLAWRPVSNFSIGVGAMISFGSVDLDKGLVPVESMNMLLASQGVPYTFTDTPASINLTGRAATTVGVNVGVLWDITPRWSVGASFRSKMNLTVKCGDASVSYANEMAGQLLQQSLGILDQANFKATMPAVAVLNVGAAFRPVAGLVIAADVQWNGWSAYKTLDIEFLSETLKPYNQYLTKNYKNSMTYHLGAQYSLTRRFDVRAGLMIDTTPVNSEHYNPETPGMTKIEPSVGFSFSPVKNFAIDAALQYVGGVGGKDKSCTYADLLTNTQRTFTADYSVHAWNPAIGFRLNF